MVARPVPVIEQSGLAQMGLGGGPGTSALTLGPMPGGGANLGMQPGRDEMLFGGRAGPSVPRVPTSVTMPGGTYQGPQRSVGVVAPQPVARAAAAVLRDPRGGRAARGPRPTRRPDPRPGHRDLHPPESGPSLARARAPAGAGRRGHRRPSRQSDPLCRYPARAIWHLQPRAARRPDPVRPERLAPDRFLVQAPGPHDLRRTIPPGDGAPVPGRGPNRAQQPLPGLRGRPGSASDGPLRAQFRRGDRGLSAGHGSPLPPEHPEHRRPRAGPSGERHRGRQPDRRRGHPAQGQAEPGDAAQPPARRRRSHRAAGHAGRHGVAVAVGGRPGPLRLAGPGGRLGVPAGRACGGGGLRAGQGQSIRRRLSALSAVHVPERCPVRRQERDLVGAEGSPSRCRSTTATRGTSSGLGSISRSRMCN